MKNILVPFIFLLFASASFAQIKGRFGKRQDSNTKAAPADTSRANKNKVNADTSIGGFKHRNDLADSITISYRYLDSLGSKKLDSSINDFNAFYSVPAHYVTLGNNGAPAFPVVFTPILKAGWDAGFHAYDVYRFTLEETRFYRTTRPYSQINYLLASGKEQLVNILHTQNIKPNWNAGFNYRLISSPGFFQTQNTNHNNYRLFSNYQGLKKRYAAWLVLNGNKLSASLNGGIVNDSFLSDPARKRRVAVPVRLGGDVSNTFNVFSTKVVTGNIYKDFTFFIRQIYDLGKRDSIQVNDSTQEYLFYPKVRFQHTLNYSSYRFQYRDTLNKSDAAKEDSAFYKRYYDTTLPINSGLNFLVEDKWKVLSNDLSVRQFPETKNPAQFIEVGLRFENINGYSSKGTKSFFNAAAHGEYRNKTRNRAWDLLLKGEFYAAGYNFGDYNVQGSLTRYLNEKWGNVQLAFENVNRSPSFIFNSFSSFNFQRQSFSKKENITVLSAAADNPTFSLSVRNISVTNYTYFKNFYRPDQYFPLINITQVQASKKFRLNLLRRKLNLYSDVVFQQSPASSPVRVPLFYTRQRLSFEGVFFRNLNLSTGLDVNYHTPYYADNFSPVMGHFFPQDSILISNLPEVSYYFNFRIKSFIGLIKLENLNTIDFANGIAFTNNNFAAPHYPAPGLIFRIGVRWSFVN